MNQLNLFIELTRLKKPIGYLLLFWPCAWGLTLIYDFAGSLNIYFYYLLLFFLGSVLMKFGMAVIKLAASAVSPEGFPSRDEVSS